MDLQIILGEAEYSVDTNSFEYQLYLDNDSTILSLSDFSESENLQATQKAIIIKNWIELNLEKVKEFVCSRLIDLKNNSWLQENESPIIKSEFIKRLKFDGVNAFKEGNFEIYFKDGELFGGHWIVVDVSENFEIEDAEIRG